MEYKKIKRDNYNIHLLNTDRYKTISVDIIFSKKFNKQDVINLILLSKILVSSTNKYKNSRDLSIVGEELYGANVSSHVSTTGNIERMNVSLDFLNPAYVEDELVKNSFDFLSECLFKPNIIKNKFDEIVFNNSKKSIVNSILSIKDNAPAYGYVKYRNVMYKGTPTSFHKYNHVDDIKNISNSFLYSFYKNYILKSKIDIFITGNIHNENEYIKYVDKYFGKLNIKYNDNLSFKVSESKSKYISLTESRDFNQSCLFIGYKFLDLTEYERFYVIHLYSSILGGINNSLLFTDIREKNSLCYSISASVNRYPVSITIETDINKSNYKKTVSLVENCLNKMKNEKIIKPLLETAKNTLNTSLNIFYDDKDKMVNHYYAKEFESIDDIETRRKKFMNVTVEEIININKKIHKSVIYFLEGVSDEEDII